MITPLLMLLSAVGLSAGATLPAQAATGQSKICADARSWTYLKAKDIVTGASNNLTPYDDNGDLIGECTTYHTASNWRVDTDPMGASYSYRIRYDVQRGTGDYDIGPWNSCHTNSNNASSDPVDPSSGTNWRIVYKNYNHGDCTN
jgi:hypothetical protein